MANARKQNVLVLDTTGQIDGNLMISAIKLVAGSDAATLTIKADSTSGAVIWAMAAASANAHTFESAVELILPVGAYFTFTGTAPVAYVILK